MIPSLALLWIVVGILFLIGIFSPKTKKLALKIKSFILKTIAGLIKALLLRGRKLIMALIIGILLIVWSLKQKFLG